MQHIPRKRFGQNFLIDNSIIDSIVRSVNPKVSDNVVEIGPGLAAITKPLSDRLNHLHVVEIDRDIVSRLSRQFPAEKLSIHSIDALKFDFSTLGEKLRIVGNLPYNISSPLLFHLADYRSNITDMHFMLQKEVVDRMVAEPNTADYGRLTVMLQYRFHLEWLLDVPPESFNPPPKVNSAVVRLIPREDLTLSASVEKALNRVVTAAFAQRRKTLRNTLSGLFTAEELSQSGIDPQARAESLSVEQFIGLATVFANREQA
ncbi:16S rRNA (adenine(1518)-N(6)/adenine(1519)-N(6))-dimethyltransferase RsmA [Leeia sp. TBRC 13508]|uniref:Ribosomal RNA small subunit methyltransferase A n=1 Tax=Leeia speluncae TaxID=2884804 RepID=A0ABS8D719_9NEIS|nr:16S rRNA (adenine(1518)-N(6)/adenine(1519)-N(6))-dimethyltransferase RsmA [Leeia speluncae]MCB6183438.1 16S rRNA (adenine(1518)-N(6)/adenine(1519)-N(6))-dimethyltransferase RsmA [Leeia speluncae]